MASSIVKSAAQQLGSLLVEEAKYLYGVRRKIESLQMELEWIECFLKDADTQQHRDEVICKWVSQVRDFAYDGEDIIERFLHEVSHHQQDGVWNTLKWGSCIMFTGDAMTLHNLCSDLDYLTLRMSELTSRLQRYGVQLIKPTTSLEYYNREEWRTYSHTEEDVVGLKEDILKVVDQLLNTDVKVVAISGTGGLGKSTLARKVFKHKDIKHHFNNNCAWVYISKEVDKKTIFQEILLGFEKDEEARKKIKEKLKVEELAGEISKVLQERRCLVVVDDIWTEAAWKSLKPAFESVFSTASASSKILLTTRNQRLLQHVDPSGYLHLLQLLSDDDSWELLKRKAFIGHGSTGGESSTRGQRNKTGQNEPQDKAKVELGRKMLKHCSGLPLAIVALGGILSTKYSTSEWEDVEKNISSYLMGGIERGGDEDGNPTLRVLELSYHDLPFYLKPCFLYMGNFPEDYKIFTQRLYHLWEAEGLLMMEGEAKKKRGTSYDICERYLNELIQRSMVQLGERWTSGRIKSCHVHDVMRDMCLRKCEEVSFLHHIKCTTSSDVASTMPVLSNEIKKLRRCALYDENGDWLDTHFQNGERVICLRSLLVFCEVGTLQTIWKAFPLLRVLDLQGIYISYVDGVEHLIHLRYLNLRNSSLEVLPARLYELKYLETLDLRCRRSYQMELCNEFYKMKRLRHLYLPRTFKVKGGKKLKFPIDWQMETIKNFDPEICETQELMQMANLRVFSIRRDYVFKKVEELKRVMEALVMKNAGQLINECRIQISVKDVIKETPSPSPREGSGITRDEETRAAHNPSLTHKYESMGDLLLGLENLPTLHVLYLQGSSIREATIKMSVSPGSFPQLTELHVECPVRSSNLRFLNLMSGCDNLNKLKNIPNSLTEVKLWRCVIKEGEVSALQKLPLLKSLEVRGGQVSNKILSFSAGSFPQLTRLVLDVQMEFFEWEVGEAAAPNLQILELWGCNNLSKFKNIPNTLTKVKLDFCKITQGDILGLEKLPHLKSLLVDGGEVSDELLSFSAGGFPQLTELTLKGEMEWEEWEVGNGALANLQSLKLQGWNILKKVVMNEFPDSLTQVKLKACEIGGGDVSLLRCLERLPSLQKLEIDEPARSGGDNKLSISAGTFPKLAELDLTWHPEWEEWEVGDGALPNLQLLKLRGWKKLNKLNNLPNSLRRVHLTMCEIGEATEDVLLLALNNIPCLEQLDLWSLEIGSGVQKISFSPGSFLQLTQLCIFWPNELGKWELEVGDGALPKLQKLVLWKCSKLKKIPNRGLPASVHIECESPCIKGIENYNTCPHFKKQGRLKRIWRSKPMRWLHDSCA